MACKLNKYALLNVKAKMQGFTLIEIILSIVVLSISLSIISSLIAPTEEQSADAILQIKAAELGQSLMNDINSRAFDDNSDMTGGRLRCDDGTQPDCTDEVNFGVEAGEIANNINTFDDVDDFHGFIQQVNAINAGLDSGYTNFVLNVEVTYDGDSLSLANNRLAKKITVSVETPLGTVIEFASHKANF